jgi:ankyrin repeat protein
LHQFDNPKWLYGVVFLKKEELALEMFNLGYSVEPFDDRSHILYRAIDAKLEDFSIAVIDSGQVEVNLPGFMDTSFLSEAIENGSERIVRHLINAGADLNKRGRFDELSLHVAAEEDSLIIVEYLVNEYKKKGISLDVKDRFGLTPLHRAANRKQLEIYDFLISEGANPLARNDFSKTPEDFLNEDD